MAFAFVLNFLMLVSLLLGHFEQSLIISSPLIQLIDDNGKLDLNGSFLLSLVWGNTKVNLC